MEGRWQSYCRIGWLCCFGEPSDVQKGDLQKKLTSLKAKSEDWLPGFNLTCIFSAFCLAQRQLPFQCPPCRLNITICTAAYNGHMRVGFSPSVIGNVSGTIQQFHKNHTPGSTIISNSSMLAGRKNCISPAIILYYIVLRVLGIWNPFPTKALPWEKISDAHKAKVHLLSCKLMM